MVRQWKITQGRLFLVVVQLMSAYISPGIRCTTTTKWPNLCNFPMLGHNGLLARFAIVSEFCRTKESSIKARWHCKKFCFCRMPFLGAGCPVSVASGYALDEASALDGEEAGPPHAHGRPRAVLVEQAWILQRRRQLQVGKIASLLRRKTVTNFVRFPPWDIKNFSACENKRESPENATGSSISRAQR